MISFNPSVMLPDGTTLTPPRWAWILAFAFKDVEWAIIEADKPEFRQMVKGYLKDQRRYRLLKELEALEEQRHRLLMKKGSNEIKS